MPVARETLAQPRRWRTGGVGATVGSAQARGPRRVVGLSERRLAREWPLNRACGCWRAFIVGLKAEAGCTSQRSQKPVGSDSRSFPPASRRRGRASWGLKAARLCAVQGVLSRQRKHELISRTEDVSRNRFGFDSVSIRFRFGFGSVSIRFSPRIKNLHCFPGRPTINMIFLSLALVASERFVCSVPKLRIRLLTKTVDLISRLPLANEIRTRGGRKARHARAVSCIPPLQRLTKSPSCGGRQQALASG